MSSRKQTGKSGKGSNTQPTSGLTTPLLEVVADEKRETENIPRKAPVVPSDTPSMLIETVSNTSLENGNKTNALSDICFNME